MDSIQTLGLSLTAASLGTTFRLRNDVGQPTNSGNPSDIEIVLGYARKFGKNLLLGINGKVIRSSLTSSEQVSGVPIQTAVGVAVDLSSYYQFDINRNELSIGMALSNLGTN